MRVGRKSLKTTSYNSNLHIVLTLIKVFYFFVASRNVTKPPILYNVCKNANIFLFLCLRPHNIINLCSFMVISFDDASFQTFSMAKRVL